MLYRSTISWWLILPVALLLITVLIIGLTRGAWAEAIIAILTSLLVLSIFLVTHYRIKDNFLIIRCGVLYKATIDIKEIQTIKHTNNPLSSPALSLDRIEITYNNKRVMISPEKTGEFIRQLQKINPQIEYVHHS